MRPASPEMSSYERVSSSPTTPTLSCTDTMISPKFTVQQIMLLQKLKQSGLTKHQIIKGLEEIEKLDENGNLPTSAISSLTSNSFGNVSTHNTPTSPKQRPPSTGAPVYIKQEPIHPRSKSPESPKQTASPISSTPTSALCMNTSPHNMLHYSQHPPIMFNSHASQSPMQIPMMPHAGTWSNTSRVVAAATAASLLQNGFPHHNLPRSIYPTLMNNRNATGLPNVLRASNGNAIVEIDGEKVDITDELDELFRRDQAQVKEEIRKFINERHISQSAIAKATGNAISQSYISQWLAQPQDISGQKKKAMYTWYLIEKRKPAGIIGMNTSAPILFRNNESDMEYAPPICLKSKRGARFTWPKECLTILENYYNSNPYPDENKREEISNACNALIHSHKPGALLTEMDKVTTVKVYNWFANRRKDDKRRKHIEHIESMDHIGSPRRSNNVSPTYSNLSSDASHHGQEVDYVNERPDIMNYHKKEEQMALALQMAAVNHSILALVNQHREEIMDREIHDVDSEKGDDEVCSNNEFNHSNVSSDNNAMEINREQKQSVIAPSPIQA